MSTDVAVKLTTAPLAEVAAALITTGTVRTGGRLSATKTSNEALADPPADVAVQLTSVIVMPRSEPDGGVQTMLAFSVALTEYVTTAPAAPVASNTTTSSGTVSAGGAVGSDTVT